MDAEINQVQAKDNLARSNHSCTCGGVGHTTIDCKTSQQAKESYASNDNNSVVMGPYDPSVLCLSMQWPSKQY